MGKSQLEPSEKYDESAGDKKKDAAVARRQHIMDLLDEGKEHRSALAVLRAGKEETPEE